MYSASPQCTFTTLSTLEAHVASEGIELNRAFSQLAGKAWKNPTSLSSHWADEAAFDARHNQVTNSLDFGRSIQRPSTVHSEMNGSYGS